MRYSLGRARRFALGAGLTALTVCGVLAGATSAAVAGPPGTVPARPSGVVATPSNPALAVAVANWVTNGGQHNLVELGSDFSELEAAANASNMAGMSASCTHLKADVEAAQRYAAIPDAQAQHDWAAALAQYARGATDCVAGATAANSTLLTRASDEITAGSADLDKVTARLNAIAG